MAKKNTKAQPAPYTYRALGTLDTQNTGNMGWTDGGQLGLEGSQDSGQPRYTRLLLGMPIWGEKTLGSPLERGQWEVCNLCSTGRSQSVLKPGHYCG
jgi:hypothetical protein